ncbi:hypothetical protein D9M68_997290 [compost metagenome]
MILRGLDHDHEDVRAGRIVLRHEQRIAVVARVRTQLRRARVQVADLQVQAHGKTKRGQQQTRQHGANGPAPLGEQIERTPQWMLDLRLLFGGFRTQAALGRRRTDADVAEQDR